MRTKDSLDESSDMEEPVTDSEDEAAIIPAPEEMAQIPEEATEPGLRACRSWQKLSDLFSGWLQKWSHIYRHGKALVEGGQQVSNASGPFLSVMVFAHTTHSGRGAHTSEAGRCSSDPTLVGHAGDRWRGRQQCVLGSSGRGDPELQLYCAGWGKQIAVPFEPMLTANQVKAIKSLASMGDGQRSLC